MARQLAVFSVLAGLALLALPTFASADRLECEKSEAALRAAIEYETNWTPEQKDAWARESNASCWEEVQAEEAALAKQEAEFHEAVAKEEAEKAAEHERHQSGHAPKPIHRPRTVCMPVREGCGIRPQLIAYGAHAGFRRVRWPSWGGERIVGYGSLKWGATVTEPAYGPFAAKIILSEVSACKGRLWYSRETIKIGRHYGKTIERNEAIGPCYYP